MTLKATFSFLTLLFVVNLFGQTQTITGKIITESFYPVYNAKVFNADSLPLTTADINGNFKLEIPTDTKTIIIGSIGMEWKKIDLTEECSNLEIILLNRAKYDFISADKVDRLRKEDFGKLPSLHKTAFEKNIFKTDTPCYKDNFVPIKNELKEIHKRRTQMPST